ncbi:hypothetical protein ACJJTC_003784 [Scirpophaga incertulas]
MMANKGTELGKCFVTTSLYVRTLDKRTLFLSETYNYEKMAGEEFIISVTPCADESTSLGKVHRLVLVAGEGEHVPVFRSRVHYVIQSSRIEFSGDRHPPSQIGHTTYRGQAVHVAKVQSGFFAPRASFRFGDLKDELSKMGLELQERKIRPEKQDRLPVHSAIVSEAAAAPEQREVSKKKKKRADSSSKRAELGETSSRAQEHKNVPFVYVCTYLMGLLKKKFLITPSSVDPGSFGWTLLAEGSKATESKLLELYPEIKEFAIANPDYQLTLMTTLQCLKQLAQQYQLRLVVAQFLQDQPTLWSVFVFQFSEIRNSQHFPMEDAVICHACYTLLQNAEVITPRLLGHSHVCAGCGCSLTGIRLHRLEANSPLVEYYPWIRSIQNHRSDYEVCHNCWRRVSRQSAQDAQRQVVLDVNQEVAPPVLPAPPQGQRNVEASSVYLPHYKRAANTSRHCIYTNCGNAAMHLIPTFIKKMLLTEHNFYVPRSARICQHHLYTNTWDTLPQDFAISTFSVQQIEDIFNILKQETSTLDFELVEEMPNHICHYWTGLDVFEFVTLLNELPLTNRTRLFPSKLATFCKKIFQLKASEIKSDDYKEDLLSSLNCLSIDEEKIPTELALLVHTVPPKGRTCKKRKFSVRECLESIMIIVENPGDITKTVAEKKEEAHKLREPVQPYIILLGSLKRDVSKDKMVLTGAEKTRRYREKLKRERPEEYAAQCKKNLERIKSKKKKISEMTPEEAEVQREIWRKEKKKSNSNKKTQKNNKENEQAKSSSDSINEQNKITELRRRCRFLAKKYKKCVNEAKKIKTQKETSKKKYQRLQGKVERNMQESEKKINSKITEVDASLPSNVQALKGTLRVHQIFTDDTDDTVHYRDISCFCGPIRGKCDCFSPQTHCIVTAKPSRRLISTIISATTSSENLIIPFKQTTHMFEGLSLPPKKPNLSIDDVKNDAFTDTGPDVLIDIQHKLPNVLIESENNIIDAARDPFPESESFNDDHLEYIERLSVDTFAA